MSADGHVILCGLGHVGYRVALLLRRLGTDVTVITQSTRTEWVRTVEEHGATVLKGDARDARLLVEANLAGARALIVATSQDVVNIEITLDAKALRPDLVVVTRLFDQSLHELERTLGLSRALAMSGLAAPSFAAAAQGERVLASFEAEGERFVVGHLSSEAALAARSKGAATLAEAGGRSTVVAPRRVWDEVSGAPRAAAAPPRSAVRTMLAALREPAHAVQVLRKAIRQAPLSLRVISLTLTVLMLLSVVVFYLGLRLSPVDAFYFLITTVTTTGYGDINLLTAPWPLKLYGCFVMLLGSAAIATLYSIITDFIVAARFKEILGRHRVPREGHVVVVGMGHLGYRVVEELVKARVPVVAVERHAGGEFVEAVREKVPFIAGDARLLETLQRAGVGTASAVISATGDDAANLGIMLAARRANPGVRTVARLFDADFARKVKTSLSVDAAFSASLLAAPMFVAAALEPGALAAFLLSGEPERLVVVAERAGDEPGTVLRLPSGRRLVVSLRDLSDNMRP